MRGVSFEKLEISPEHKQVLKKTTITESGPGTILKDFEALLNYLRKQELPVAGTHRLPRTVLGEINGLLTRPIQLRLNRPEQKSYPHIQGLYLLLRASGLAHVCNRRSAKSGSCRCSRTIQPTIKSNGLQGCGASSSRPVDTG